MNSNDCLNSNSIDIPLNEDCCVCLATGFVTDYPPELQNIISPNEFKQSITNINQHFPKSFYSRLSFASIFIAIASALIVIGCVFLFLGITNRPGEITPIPILLGPIIIGCVILSIGLLICIPSCHCYCNQIQSTQPLIAVLEEESNKYQSHHCRWRLISKKDDPSFFVSRKDQISKFHIIIDINQNNSNV